ncbi:DUF2279 domain-containing protein [Microscilla marina]|uniref:DUF2279 domain-containing protein n=1 Tax=Microscilla marina ATCC 23134 TaxID=313606 RepID=A1ZS36_MICM2|nr:DUF2279 domain-containing protein [Microscilla marina]EAY26759.1 hypothetical protein M23134_00725 [Microscilla marina ATCC 23134]
MAKAVKYIGLLAIFLLYHSFVKAQPVVSNKDSSQVNRSRLRTLIVGSSVLYGAGLVGLNEVWYKNSPKQSFHWFDDSQEWKQVDKVGHFYSTYHFSLGASRAFRWTGLSEKKSMFWGAIMGIVVMTPIEILDGFSAGYGASLSDFFANASGAMFLYGQHALWGETRIHPKYSFHRTKYPHQRPELLGKSFSEEILKDYNGQTFWLSIDVDKFLPKGNRYPKWLNLAVGYGAENMIFARDYQNINAGLPPYRQFYLSLDLDLTAIKTKSKFLKSLIFFVNMIHLPAPAISFSSAKGVRFHGWYY